MTKGNGKANGYQTLTGARLSVWNWIYIVTIISLQYVTDTADTVTHFVRSRHRLNGSGTNLAHTLAATGRHRMT